MPDRIFVRDLHLRTIIGLHDWERDSSQDVVINLEIETDLTHPSETDELTNAVDYRTLTKRVIKHVEQSHFRLIEKLAGTIASMALEEFPPISAITVTVDKPGALRFARSVAVQLRRERP